MSLSFSIHVSAVDGSTCAYHRAALAVIESPASIYHGVRLCRAACMSQPSVGLHSWYCTTATPGGVVHGAEGW